MRTLPSTTRYILRDFSVDGRTPHSEVHDSREDLFRALCHSHINATVLAWDDSDLAETGSASIRPVTKEVANDYWFGPGADDCQHAIEDEKPVPGILEAHLRPLVDGYRRRITGRRADGKAAA